MQLEMMRNQRADGTRHSVGLIKYWLGRAWLGLFGWTVCGEVPSGSKYVLVGAPHTSNWDFPFAIAACYVFRIRIHWMGKDALFRWPYGWFMRMLGGIAIDRSNPHGVVREIAGQYKKHDNLIIVIAAKGTRKKTEYWKSGFYWIAHTAEVPVLCGYLDYRNRRACLGPTLLPSGDVKKDMEQIRVFFKDMHGKHPQQEDVIRLREEDK